jgi:hypothetical protein
MSSFLTAKYSGQASSNWSGQLSSTSAPQPATLEKRVEQLIGSIQPPASVDLSGYQTTAAAAAATSTINTSITAVSSSVTALSSLVSTAKVKTGVLEYSGGNLEGCSIATSYMNLLASQTGSRMAGHCKFTYASFNMDIMTETVMAGSDVGTITFTTPYAGDNLIITLTPRNMLSAQAQAYISTCNRNGFTVGIAIDTTVSGFEPDGISWNYQVIAAPV